MEEAANQEAKALLSGTACFVDDGAYEEQVKALLPRFPETSSSQDNLAFANQYKREGNVLFEQSNYAWALRTYLVGVHLFQRINYETPDLMLYDLSARAYLVASFSNSALCALKMGHHDLASKLCDAGLRFGPEGLERAKLMMRKAQALLDHPVHADPHEAIALLMKAGQAANSRQIQQLLNTAKRAAREKSKASERALFGGRGLSGARISTDEAQRADARHELEELMRKGHALLFGTGAEREFVPPELREMRGDPAPEKSAAAARSHFSSAQKLAKEAGLRAAYAHATFSRAAAASVAQDWREAADGFEDYFKLEADLLSDSSSEPYCEPQLGVAFARFHRGFALYQLREVEPAVAQLEAYLEATDHFKEMRICTTDSWGNEIFTELDKEMQRQRQWMVCGRCKYSAHRILASLLTNRAASLRAEDEDAMGQHVRDALTCAMQHLEEAMLCASNNEEKKETTLEFERISRLLESLPSE